RQKIHWYGRSGAYTVLTQKPTVTPAPCSPAPSAARSRRFPLVNESPDARRQADRPRPALVADQNATTHQPGDDVVDRRVVEAQPAHDLRANRAESEALGVVAHEVH